MTTQEFIFDTPLFCKVEGDDLNAILNDLLSVKRAKFDGYNAQRGIESTFEVSYSLNCRYNLENVLFGNVGKHATFEYLEPWHVTLKCGRYGDTIDIMLILNPNDRSIKKVGQYPSIADVHKQRVKQYNKILSEKDMTEFTRAIGLAASGVGIGSFVYLRRIFEKLIFEAYSIALQESRISEDEYNRLRMNERIKVLKDYLPSTLVEIADVYGILSKGIHQLSEEECLTYFEALKSGIEIILDDKLEQKKKQDKRKNALQAVSKIANKIKKGEQGNNSQPNA